MINHFRDAYNFLSNFYEAPVTYDGLTFKNNESAFQSAKARNVNQKRIFTQTDGKAAKRLGRKVALREDWEDIKEDLMADIVWAKFTQNSDLQEKLLATGDQKLVEGNTWNDTYWGVCNGRGQNKLGKILMQVRDELRLRTHD